MKTLDDIVALFEFLDDWDQRYQYLIELGDTLPEMPANLKNDTNKVKGCMSQVWVSPYRLVASPDLIGFHGDCDSPIIKGILALLIQLSENKTPENINTLDVDAIFSRLQLDDHLSPNRHVGVYAIVLLMKQQVNSLTALSEKSISV